jgi:hypothetical protein
MQQNFLGDMQTIVTGQVESVTRYEIDSDSKGGSIWITKASSGKNPNVLGREIIKIRMPYAMFEQLKSKQESGEIEFPCNMEILCEIDMGGQNRAVLTAISAKKVVSDIPKSDLGKTEVKPSAKPQ